ALRAAGVAAGDRVAFIDRNGPEWFEVTFGLAKLGAVNVSVNWRLAPPEMATIIADAGAEVGILGPDFVDHLAKIQDALDRVPTRAATPGSTTTPGSTPSRPTTRAWPRPPTTSPSSSTRRARPGCPRGRCSPTTTSSAGSWASPSSGGSPRTP